MKKPARAPAPAEEQLAIEKLTSDPRQIRRHTDRNLTMIGDGLKAVGAARSIVVDESNAILAGNGTIEAARLQGFTKVRIIEADGSEIIAVRRRGLSEKQKVELALYDNRSSDFAEYDASALARITDLVGVDAALFFSPAEHAAMFGGEAGASAASLVERFGVPPFTVLDARQGYWQARKAAWHALGIESELGRGEMLWPGSEHVASPGLNHYRDKKRGRAANATPGGGALPAANYSKTKARGDGRGRPIRSGQNLLGLSKQAENYRRGEGAYTKRPKAAKVPPGRR